MSAHLERIEALMHRDRRALGGEGVHGLALRFAELSRTAGDRYLRHVDALHSEQRRLRAALEAWTRDGAGDPPDGAWPLATRPADPPCRDAAPAPRDAPSLFHRALRFAPPRPWSAPPSRLIP